MGWETVARAVIDRRVELGHHSRQAFADASGISIRTLGDIESARRDSYAKDTLARLEQALAWPSGRIDALVRVESEPPDTRPLEREGDDLALMALLAGSGLPPADQLRITLHIRRRRAEQHAELAAEVRAMVEQAGGDIPGGLGGGLPEYPARPRCHADR